MDTKKIREKIFEEILDLIDEFEYLEDEGMTFWAKKGHREFSRNIIDFKEEMKKEIIGKMKGG